MFEGEGILKNIHKNNWVSGNFKKGNFIKILDSSNGG
jgi:hypothetical protein